MSDLERKFYFHSCAENIGRSFWVFVDHSIGNLWRQIGFRRLFVLEFVHILLLQRSKFLPDASVLIEEIALLFIMTHLSAFGLLTNLFDIVLWRFQSFQIVYPIGHLTVLIVNIASSFFCLFLSKGQKADFFSFSLLFRSDLWKMFWIMIDSAILLLP